MGLTRRSFPRTLTAAATLAAFLLAALPPPALQHAAGDAATVREGELPTARQGTSAAWDGSRAHVFGGTGCEGAGCSFLRDVLRYDPGADTVQVTLARLPTGRSGTAAAWSGNHAFVLGGFGCLAAEEPCTTAGTVGFLDEIVRYHPNSGGVAVMPTRLPQGLEGAAAAWDGTYVWLFGGKTAAGATDAIVRYRPSSDTLGVVATKLPSPRFAMGAAWDGTYVWLFGGFASGAPLDQVLRFRPADLGLAAMAETLPSPRTGTSAAWIRGDAYVFGGGTTGGLLDEVVRYNPVGDLATVMSARLPSGVFAASAVAGGIDAYLFGGVTAAGSESRAITRYNLAPGAPQNLLGTRGPGLRQATLAWEAPPSNTYSELRNYHVYRAAAAAGPWSLIATVGKTPGFTDQDLEASTTYWYRVTASNAAGEGPPSNPVSVSTFASPGPPRNLGAEPGPRPAQVTLTWEPPADPGDFAVTGYFVYRGPNSGQLTFLGKVGNVLRYVDQWPPNLSWAASGSFHYAVRAVNQAGAGPLSAEASCSPPATAAPGLLMC